MGCILKCGEKVFRSVFKTEQHLNEVSENGYRQVLTIERSQEEFVHVVNEFSNYLNRGCFIECHSIEGCQIVCRLASQYSLLDELIVFEKMEEVKKVVPYEGEKKPWFLSEKDKFILEDTFVS